MYYKLEGAAGQTHPKSKPNVCKNIKSYFFLEFESAISKVVPSKPDSLPSLIY